jgi:hypothetical protein
MKKTAAALTLAILCACGREFTGLGSVDLRVTSIAFHDSDPATITGILESGKPADFLAKLGEASTESVTIHLPPGADTSGMALVFEGAAFPLYISANSPEPAARVTIEHNGLNWSPAYRLIPRGSGNVIYAAAEIGNETGQTWHTDTIRLVNPSSNAITTATGTITIHPGRNPIPWWNAPVLSERAELRYGWPTPGRWNPLLALHCPDAGAVEDWAGEIHKSGDTLWLPAEHLLTADLTWQQMPAEYRCTLTLQSSDQEERTWHIIWPDRMPRGAAVIPGEASIRISPGNTAAVHYREVY